MYAMQEKKVDKNTFAEKSEDVWSAMQEVRIGPGLSRKIRCTNFAKTGTFLTSQHCKIKFSYHCAKFVGFCSTLYSDIFALRKQV